MTANEKAAKGWPTDRRLEAAARLRQLEAECEAMGLDACIAELHRYGMEVACRCREESGDVDYRFTVENPRASELGVKHALAAQRFLGPLNPDYDPELDA